MVDCTITENLVNMKTALGQGMSDSRFRALIEKGADIIVVIDHEGKILYGSPSIKNYFGTDDAENLGKSAFEYAHPDDLPLLIGKFQEVLANPGKAVSVEARALSQERLIWVEGIVTNLLTNEGINGIVCNFRDVTEKKEAERMFRESEALSHKLEQQLSEEKLLRQKQIMQATIDGQEREREEIGRELHDNVNQILTTARLYLDCITGATAEQEPIIRRSSDIITTAIEEIRKLSRSMTQTFHCDLGLRLSIEDLLENIPRVDNKPQLNFDFLIDNEQLLDDKLKTAIFRIIQEQLNNILKHAAASVIDVSLRQEKHGLYLLVSDNGKGFELQSKRQGIGLNNIIIRAELFNGQAGFESAPGKGCTLSVCFPL